MALLQKPGVEVSECELVAATLGAQHADADRRLDRFDGAPQPSSGVRGPRPNGSARQTGEAISRIAVGADLASNVEGFEVRRGRLVERLRLDLRVGVESLARPTDTEDLVFVLVALLPGVPLVCCSTGTRGRRRSRPIRRMATASPTRPGTFGSGLTIRSHTRLGRGRVAPQIPHAAVGVTGVGHVNADVTGCSGCREGESRQHLRMEDGDRAAVLGTRVTR